MRHFAQLPLPLLLTGAFLAILLVSFVVGFLIPALRYWTKLRASKLALEALPDNAPEGFRAIFATDSRLAALWRDYEESLHEERQERDGRLSVTSRRSTVSAETFFNAQFVVDSSVRAEFFRHLPGVFTGIGIIGTFSGLIGGLRAFQPDFGAAGGGTPVAPDQIQQAVKALLHEVSTAFFVSAAAITSAMVVTLVEKILIASLYRLTEDIAQAIDARFDAGVGEDYLYRIAQNSEESATQLKVLKDALVKDLGQILVDISESHIRASNDDSRALASSISASISESLTGPMNEIAGTVRVASGDQSASATRMLQDVMASFSEKLNSLFGGQIAGINDVNRETAQTMRESVQSLNTLVANIEKASANSGDLMASRMADALEKMERRQDTINQQTTAFVEQLRAIVSASQSETNQKLQQTLSDLGQQVGGMIDSLRASSAEALSANRNREEAMAATAQSAVTTMTGSVEGAVREISAASVKMQDAVSQIARVNTTAIDKMNYGADTLNAASSNFAQAGDRVTGAMTQAASVAGKLTELSGALSSSSAALQQTVGDYRSHRDAVAGLVTELRTIVGLVKSEASMTADVLAHIESATDKLINAQVQADSYLQNISKVLVDAHTAFAGATGKTLDRVNADFHEQLSSAVKLLSSSIRELETSLSSRN